jgi:hypothetical protein
MTEEDEEFNRIEREAAMRKEIVKEPTTKNDALKLALEALESADWYINQLEITLYPADDAGTHEDRLKVQQAITVLRLEIDAQNMSSKSVAWEQFYPDIGKPQLKDKNT